MNTQSSFLYKTGIQSVRWLARFAVSLPCLLMTLHFAGCAAHTTPAQDHSESDPYLREGRIQFESGTTPFLVDVVRIDSGRNPGGLLEIVATLRNKAKSPLWLDVRTTFLDAKGHVLEKTNWQPVQLDARTVTEYSCRSLGAAAADYQIILRKPDKSSRDLP